MSIGFSGSATHSRSFALLSSCLDSSRRLIGQPEGPEVAEHALGIGALGDLGEREALVVLRGEEGEELAPGVVSSVRSRRWTSRILGATRAKVSLIEPSTTSVGFEFQQA